VFQHIKLVRDHSRAKGAARAIMYALASRADHSGLCFPSIETIALDAGCSRSSVAHILPDLVAAGEISITHKAGHVATRGGNQPVNVYQILIQGHAIAGHPDLPQGHAKDASKGMQPLHYKKTEKSGGDFSGCLRPIYNPDACMSCPESNGCARAPDRPVNPSTLDNRSANRVQDNQGQPA